MKPQDKKYTAWVTRFWKKNAVNHAHPKVCLDTIVQAMMHIFDILKFYLLSGQKATLFKRNYLIISCKTRLFFVCLPTESVTRVIWVWSMLLGHWSLTQHGQRPINQAKFLFILYKTHLDLWGLSSWMIYVVFTTEIISFGTCFTRNLAIWAFYNVPYSRLYSYDVMCILYYGHIMDYDIIINNE